MTEPSAPAGVLSPDAATRLIDFARTCKAAARAVSLYPKGHPAIESTLGRLAQVTTQLTERGPFRLQVFSDRLLVEGAGIPRPDSAVAELAQLLHRHVIGLLTVNVGAGSDSWRTLLLLLGRSPDEVRADGGIAHLWATAGGPSIEIQEIDYTEVLRERQGVAASIESIVAAAMAGPRLQLDDRGMAALLEIVADPAKLDELMKRLEHACQGRHGEAQSGAFLNIARELTEYISKTDPGQLATLFQRLGHAACGLTADGMLGLLAQRGFAAATGGGINVITSVIDGMSDASVADFIAGSVIAERGATERLAHVFRALAPESDRQRQLLALAEEQVATSELGQESGFQDLWQRVEGMLTSYSDAKFVSDDYARELSYAQRQPLDVERTTDDPPERIAAWLSTVNDAALRGLDHALLIDLLAIEPDPRRWRDVAETVVSHVDDLVRVGYFDRAWQLIEAVVEQSSRQESRQPYAADALAQFGRAAMMKHVAAHMRGADEDSYERFKRICHAIGPSAVAPLAEVLSAEQDARSRRRLRDILIGFGSRGREAVQQLMNAHNWEVRRTAAYLLREFGGSEGLEELVPLLTDAEPLVQREAIQGLVLSGSEQAAEILLRALVNASGRARETLVGELMAIRDDRATPLFCYLVRRMDRRALPHVYAVAIDALGTSTAPQAIEALTFALHQGDWWTPFRTRRFRTAAAQSLRRIGTPAAREVLRECSSRGPRGVRTAARAELAQMD